MAADENSWSSLSPTICFTSWRIRRNDKNAARAKITQAMASVTHRHVLSRLACSSTASNLRYRSFSSLDVLSPPIAWLTTELKIFAKRSIMRLLAEFRRHADELGR